MADLDFTRPPAPMSRADEVATVQYFTDMAGIERLAKALFAEQRKRATDPLLEQIFAEFVAEEEKHAIAAERLAAHFDVHHYKEYRQNPHLVAFTPAFVELVSLVSAEIANVYITTGEVLLDVALLRSICDKVDDPTVRDVLARINHDESRHIAIDFHMVEYYASPEWERKLAAQPAAPIRAQIRAIVALLRVLWLAKPFLRDVFFAPMDRCDPSGRRMNEAFKRIQLLAAKPGVARRPFVRFMSGIRALHDSPAGRLLTPLLVRVSGVDARVLRTLHTAEEAEKARRASFDELTEATLALKHSA